MLPRIIAEHTRSGVALRAAVASSTAAGGGSGVYVPTDDASAAAEELSVCVELLHTCTFAVGGSGNGGSSTKSPGGRPIDVVPVIRLAEKLAASIYKSGTNGGGGAANNSSNNRVTSPNSSADGAGGGAAAEDVEPPQLTFEELRATKRHGFAAAAAAAAQTPSLAGCASPATSSASAAESARSSLSGASGRPPVRAFTLADRKRRREAEQAAAAQEASSAAAPAAAPAVKDPFAFGEDDDDDSPAPKPKPPNAKGPAAKKSPASAAKPAAAADPFDFDSPPIAKFAKPKPRVGKQPAAAPAAKVESGPASPLSQAPPSGAVASPATPQEEEGGSEEPQRVLLEHSLRGLVNITNGCKAGCEAMARHGMRLAALVIASELRGSEGRSGMADHYDCAMMAVGLLTNCLEMCKPAAPVAGRLPCALLDASNGGGAAASVTTITLTVRLARTLKALLLPLPGSTASSSSLDAGGDGGEGGSSAAAGPKEPEWIQEADDGEEEVELSEEAAEAKMAEERYAMEREVSAAYIALLLGFICKSDPGHAASALAELGQKTFAGVGKLLRSFLELQSAAGLIERESAKTMLGIVEWCMKDEKNKGKAPVPSFGV